MFMFYLEHFCFDGKISSSTNIYSKAAVNSKFRLVYCHSNLYYYSRLHNNSYSYFVISIVLVLISFSSDVVIDRKRLRFCGYSTVYRKHLKCIKSKISRFRHNATQLLPLARSSFVVSVCCDGLRRFVLKTFQQCLWSRNEKTTH